MWCIFNGLNETNIMEIYTATLIVQKHINWQNDKRNLPKVSEEKLKEATNLLRDLVKNQLYMVL